MTAPFAWTPSREVIEHSNVHAFMRRHGIADYAELIRRTTADIVWFWDAMVRELPIEFFEPYQQVLDTSRGIPWARWFVGGKLNLAHNCVDRHAAGPNRDRLALIWEGEDGGVRRLTYAQLAEQSAQLAAGLKQLGIARGDCVGLFMPMLPETVIAFMALARLGAICTPIFSGYGPQAVAARLVDCEAKALITADGFYRKGHVIPLKKTADEAADLAASVRHVVVFRRLGLETPVVSGRDRDWSEVASAAAASGACAWMDAEDPFLIAYTSGTTGKPKGSVHVHGGFLVKIAQEVCHQVDMHAEDVLYWVTDMGWIMGPWEVVGGLARGGTVVLYEGAPDYPAPDRVWSMVERHGITILGISPTLIRALMKHGAAPVRKHDLSRLRILGSTGEPWNPAPWQWYFEEVGGRRCPVINLSGGTEVGACFLSPLPITPLRPCALVGPSLGMAIDILDAEGKPLREGVGELVCTKPWPSMTRGIWKDPERYLQTYWSRWSNVWVHGDWASRDEDGLWYLHGRSDDTIKIAGKRLGPAEIESILVGDPAVAEAAAVGVPHELKGEAIWCYAVLKHGHEASEELRRALGERVIAALGKSFAPEQVKFVRELPKTRSAKILRRAIRARIVGEDAGDLSSLENPHALEEIVRAV